ncbi:uncharacterized protein LOC106670293 isoform X2 [Cimex lectularius]|uniref:Phospholipid scramblase n=1 Tax=Cimex lectularius TaxID=79782 RepID=A0A8I6SA15_CIMLE|nr:uncharacterized protein LOC106670293 isoform X2 [Cimex lectularius]
MAQNAPENNELPTTDESTALAGASTQNSSITNKREDSNSIEDKFKHYANTIGTTVFDVKRKGVIVLPKIPQEIYESEVCQSLEKAPDLYVIRMIDETNDFSFTPTSHYKICYSSGQTCMLAGELASKSHLVHKTIRPFVTTIIDMNHEPFMIIKRPACCKYFWNATNERVFVYLKPNNYIGSVKQICSMMSPRFKISIPNGRRVYKIYLIEDLDSVWEVWSSSTKFRVQDNRNNLVGTIFKIKWKGKDNESKLLSGGFKVSFINHMESVSKALIIASGFLIECMYFGK